VDKQYKYVGKSYPIHDALLKVTGELVYTGDLQFPRMLHARLLPSPIAHGRIVEIDTSRAEALPGVVGVFSHVNSPHTFFNSYRTFPGQDNCPEDQRLFQDRVRFFGEWVAAVVAVSEEIAREAVALIRVKYEALPVISDLSHALESGVDIHPGGNLIRQYQSVIGDGGDPQPGEGRTVATVVRTPRMHHATMETHVCLAKCDVSGKITIWSPCQGAFGVRTVVADFLGLSYNQVRVVKSPIGGSFGGKQEATLEPLVAFLAQQTRAAVLLKLTRRECILSTLVRPEIETAFTTTFDPEGRMQRCNMEAVVDAGGYATNAMDYIAGTMGKISKLYRIPNIRYQARSVYTNGPVSGAMRGWGSPEFFSAAEIHLDLACKELGLDPLELRLRNLVQPGDIDTATRLSLGNVGITACLEQGAAQFDWQRRSKLPAGQGRIRTGVGFACGAHKTSMFGGYPEFSTMTLKMNEDGTFVLNTAVQDLGCGSLQCMKIIVAEVLQIHPDQISVLEADTDASPYDFGTYASRVTYVCGACAEKTARALLEQILDVASRALGRPRTHLAVGDGFVHFIKEQGQPSGQKISFAEIGMISKVRYHLDLIATETHTGSSNPGAYGAHFAEVQVDTLTGLVRVSDYLAVHDIGRVINRSMSEGQVQGAVQMGIGFALSEEIAFNEKGKIIQDTLKNYHVVNAPDMPQVQVLLLERGGDGGPFAAKAIGEVAAVPVAAAVVNAVNNALGTRMSHLPLTPKRIIAALNGE